jgi:hypothetical protein
MRDLKESASYFPSDQQEGSRREGTPMPKVVADEAAREDLAASLDEIVGGARRMLARRWKTR